MTDLLRKAMQMRDAINDVELALAGLEIDTIARRWEDAHDSVMIKVPLGAIRQLANSYPALNYIMNTAEFNPSALTDEERKS